MITYEEYKNNALRTIKPHGSKELAVADWALGMGGEFGEVLQLRNSEDTMEKAKEIGDVLWYLTALQAEAGIEVHADPLMGDCPSMVTDWYTSLAIKISQLQEMMKHRIMHKEKGSKEQISQIWSEAMKCLKGVAEQENNIKIGLIAELNVAKLSHRYHGGQYTHAASANRHEQERKFESTDKYKSLKKAIEEGIEQ